MALATNNQVSEKKNSKKYEAQKTEALAYAFMTFVR